MVNRLSSYNNQQKSNKKKNYTSTNHKNRCLIAAVNVLHREFSLCFHSQLAFHLLIICQSIDNRIVDDMVSKHIAAGVVICKNALTPSALKAVRECNQTNRTLHVFQLNEVVVNITHHELVPKHVVQTPEQKKELLDRYRLKEQQLPRIKVTDPVAKYLGLKRGQVVKIIREDSPTAGRYVSYRLVF
eukprot:m.115924 g.115924  ORF g.115924 m.115924 type:complete len:187 (-) comp13585_c0_seq4:110-670(-)